MRHHRSLLVSLLSVTAWTVAIAGSPPGLASGPSPSPVDGTCHVVNANQGVTYGPDEGRALTKALRAAETGDALDVTGRCSGGFAVRRGKDVTVRGKAGEPVPVLDGGGSTTTLFIAGGAHLVLTDVILTGSPKSGTLYNRGKAEIYHVQVIDNVSLTPAVSNTGAFFMTDSVVARNTPAEFGQGGGMSNRGKGVMTIRNSRIVDNVSSRDGGGITSYGTVAELHVVNTTISRNAGRFGGGIFSSAGDLTIDRSTITHNTASVRGGGINNVGGGTVRHSVVKHNEPDDCFGIIC